MENSSNKNIAPNLVQNLMGYPNNSAYQNEFLKPVLEVFKKGEIITISYAGEEHNFDDKVKLGAFLQRHGINNELLS